MPHLLATELNLPEADRFQLARVVEAAQSRLGSTGGLLQLEPGRYVLSEDVPIHEPLWIKGVHKHATEITVHDGGRIIPGWHRELEPASLPFRNYDSHGRQQWLYIPSSPLTLGREVTGWDEVTVATWHIRFRFNETSGIPPAGVYLSASDDHDRPHARLYNLGSNTWEFQYTIGDLETKNRNQIRFEAEAKLNGSLDLVIHLGLIEGSANVFVNGQPAKVVHGPLASGRLRGQLFGGLKVGSDGPFSWQDVPHHWYPYLWHTERRAKTDGDWRWTLESLSLHDQNGLLAELDSSSLLKDGVQVQIGASASRQSKYTLAHLVGPRNQQHPHKQWSLKDAGISDLTINTTTAWCQPIALGKLTNFTLRDIHTTIGSNRPVCGVSTMANTNSWHHKVKDCSVNGWLAGLCFPDGIADVTNLRVHHPGRFLILTRSSTMWVDRLNGGPPMPTFECVVYHEGRESGGTLSLARGFVNNEYDTPRFRSFLYHDATFHHTNRIRVEDCFSCLPPSNAMVELAVRDWQPGLYGPGWLVVEAGHDPSPRNAPMIAYRNGVARSYWAKAIRPTTPIPVTPG